jgi:hypothetical protein
MAHDQSPEQQPEPGQPSRTPPPWIFGIIGWVMGGLSFLDLIRDLTPLKLYGLVEEWVGAYGLLVKQVTEFLFGWIDWRWMRVTEAEGHWIVLGAILWSAFMRGMARADSGLAMSNLEIVLKTIAFVLIWAVGPAVLIPQGYFGPEVIVMVLGIGVATIIVNSKRTAVDRQILQELAGIAAVIAVTVLINYTIFSPR